MKAFKKRNRQKNEKNIQIFKKLQKIWKKIPVSNPARRTDVV